MKLCVTLYVATPIMSYGGAEQHCIPVSNSSREVNLSCPIQPGALRESYSVYWVSEPLGVFSNEYEISVTVNQSSSLEYQCMVSIQHRSDQNTTATYYSPAIILKEIGKFLNSYVE